MLLTFSVENYKGFKKRQTFSMIASSGNEHSEHLYTLPNGVRVNTFACIIGPNGSGKTHLLESMQALSLLMSDRKIGSCYSPFLLDENSNGSPTTFEVLLYNSIDERVYRYGVIFKQKEIIEEWLYSRTLNKSSKEKRIFVRKKGGLSFNREYASIEKLLLNVSTEATIISFANAISNEILMFAYYWATSNIISKSPMTSFSGLERLALVTIR